MNPRHVVLPALLLSPVLLIAQQPPPSSGAAAATAPAQSGATLYITVPEGQPCPVSLQAKQGYGNGLVKVRHAPDPQPDTLAKPAQHIHLIVTNPASTPHAPKIVGATVTARGLSARARLDKASAAHGPSDVRRTLNVTFSPENDNALSADLDLPGFTSVKSIKIEALTYADGSTRDLAGQKLCTVAPDPLMLIADR